MGSEVVNGGTEGGVEEPMDGWISRKTEWNFQLIDPMTESVVMWVWKSSIGEWKVGVEEPMDGRMSGKSEWNGQLIDPIAESVVMWVRK
jgi:hypothetical protein